MRVRFWVLIAAAVLAIGLAGCGPSRVSRGLANTPVPTKTLRPTFTATVPKPTLTPSPVAAADQPVVVDQVAAAPAATEAPTATPEPPTPEPSPTAEPAAFTVNSATLNVRGGPGTAFAVLGRLSNGQSFPITGKNTDGSWWQFDYNGRTGWVAGSNVSVRNGDTVQIAQNIPAAPTAAPRPAARPTARPAAPAPAQPQPAPQPAPATKFRLTGKVTSLPNPVYITFWCFVINKSATARLPGTIRVSGPGGSKDQAFSDQKAFADPMGNYPVNSECKVEFPYQQGAYSAVLLEGGQPASEAFNFNVTSDIGEFIVEWQER